MKELRWVVWKETLHVIRDIRTLYLALVMPVVLLILFGYALTFDLRKVRIGVLDFDNSKDSRSVVKSLENSGYFIAEYISSPDIRRLVRGNFQALLLIPRGFSKKINLLKIQEIQLILDGTDDNTGRLILATAESIVLRWGVNRLKELTPMNSLTSDQPSIAVWFNPRLRSQPFIVSGLVALIMMVISGLLTTLTISREWETKTIEHLILTPLHSWQIIIGKIIPYLLLSMIDLFNILVVGHLLFEVPIVGSMLMLFLISLVFVIAGLAIGILMSTVAQNQRLAMQLTWLVTILPAFLLSGFIFPIENMPPVLQGITYIVPARYFLVILRGILFKGSSLYHFPSEVLLLSVFSLILLSISIRVFIKRT